MGLAARGPDLPVTPRLRVVPFLVLSVLELT
jgi:hypothetical protein